MAVNKTQVVRKAKSVGAILELTDYTATLLAPVGKTIDSMHYSSYDFGAFESRMEIWEMFMDELKVLRDCSCGCAND